MVAEFLCTSHIHREWFPWVEYIGSGTHVCQRCGAFKAYYTWGQP